MGGDRACASLDRAGDILVFQLFGGALLLAYACYRADPVFIIGQATGLVIYSRNLYFIWLGKRSMDAPKTV